MTLQVGQGQILICQASSILFKINAFYVICDFVLFLIISFGGVEYSILTS